MSVQGVIGKISLDEIYKLGSVEPREGVLNKF